MFSRISVLALCGSTEDSEIAAPLPGVRLKWKLAIRINTARHSYVSLIGFTLIVSPGVTKREGRRSSL